VLVVRWPLRPGQALVLSPQRGAGPADAWSYASARILACTLAQSRRPVPRDRSRHSAGPRHVIGLATVRLPRITPARGAGSLPGSSRCTTLAANGGRVWSLDQGASHGMACDSLGGGPPAAPAEILSLPLTARRIARIPCRPRCLPRSVTKALPEQLRSRATKLPPQASPPGGVGDADVPELIGRARPG
jgi:hypothetical protein